MWPKLSTECVTDFDKLSLFNVCYGGVVLGSSQFPYCLKIWCLLQKWSELTKKQSSRFVSLNPWHILCQWLSTGVLRYPWVACKVLIVPPSYELNIYTSHKSLYKSIVAWGAPPNCSNNQGRVTRTKKKLRNTALCSCIRPSAPDLHFSTLNK